MDFPLNDKKIFWVPWNSIIWNHPKDGSQYSHTTRHRHNVSSVLKNNFMINNNIIVTKEWRAATSSLLEVSVTYQEPDNLHTGTEMLNRCISVMRELQTPGFYKKNSKLYLNFSNNSKTILTSLQTSYWRLHFIYLDYIYKDKNFLYNYVLF